MARAGFIFQPLPSNPDNVSCFLCSKALDGWEEDDSPLEEHLKHSPECGWAITAAVEVELGEYAREDPRDALMLDARTATFADRWPHEGKKGWGCKTKQVSRGDHTIRRKNEIGRGLMCFWVAGRGRVEVHADARVGGHGHVHILPAGP